MESSKNNQTIDIVWEYCKKRKYSAFEVIFFDYNNMCMTPYIEVEGFDGVWENIRNNCSWILFKKL